ncbi:acyltransferase family protein [Planctomicrobium sp. SH661]|uniref:acyltransferase family protein n=1 Tax=Planctomicrobium sp. SH661 TaxID=3448124 RepID=UPI003F5AFCC6
MSAIRSSQLNSLAAPQLSGSASRLHALDWLRALAAVMVVMLHAAIPYMTNPLPGLRWSIEPVEQSEIVNRIGWGINTCIMPIFFLMNGYFAARLLQQRGPKAFFRHRLTRIGGPFLFGLAVILPLDLYVWLLGWVNAGLIPIQKMRSLKIRGELGDSLHGVSHLWFLEYVLIYCLAACLLHVVIQKLRPQPGASLKLPRQRHSLFISVLPLLSGIVIGGSMLWLQPRIVIGFRHGWVPFWENLVFYSIPFALGWFWEKHSPASSTSQRRWLIQGVLAGLAFLVLWPELHGHLVAESIPVSQARMPFLFATVSVLMSTALFGGALSLQLERAPAAIAYLSKASFWIYLFHHPIVALTQVDLTLITAPALVKFVIATGVTLTVCLLTYEGLVRTTLLGQLLNGARDQRGGRTLPTEERAVGRERKAA